MFVLRSTIASVALLLVSMQAGAQDIIQGKILAHDRVASVLVLSDKTVFPLDKLKGEMPADLKAGDRVEIKYEFNEDDGVTLIHSIKLLPK